MSEAGLPCPIVPRIRPPGYLPESSPFSQDKWTKRGAFCCRSRHVLGTCPHRGRQGGFFPPRPNTCGIIFPRRIRKCPTGPPQTRARTVPDAKIAIPRLMLRIRSLGTDHHCHEVLLPRVPCLPFSSAAETVCPVSRLVHNHPQPPGGMFPGFQWVYGCMGAGSSVGRVRPALRRRRPPLFNPGKTSNRPGADPLSGTRDQKKQKEFSTISLEAELGNFRATNLVVWSMTPIVIC